jgi:uncharacterized protein
MCLNKHPEILRYTTLPLPAYRYIPFQGMPHPRNDPGGHSYGQEDDYLPEFKPEDWSHCLPYLYGIDLFNLGYWWEAHEAWESVWIAAGRENRTGIFVQGLIQIAAAQLKRFMKEQRGAEILTNDGCEKLQGPEPIFLGIEVKSLTEKAHYLLETDSTDFPIICLTMASS